jgi:hypothetical protein
VAFPVLIGYVLECSICCSGNFEASEQVGEYEGCGIMAAAMIRLMVRAQRPHRTVQPKQAYSSAVRCGDSAWTKLRTSQSVITLQEQMIMADSVGHA